MRVQSLGWEDPLEKGMAITTPFLPGKFHGQKSLVDKDSDTTATKLTQEHIFKS